MNPGPFAIALGKYAGIAPAEIGSVAVNDEITLQVSRQESHIALHMHLRMLPMRKMPRRGAIGLFLVTRPFISRAL